MSFPPANSCDCHVHVIGPKSQYPLQQSRTYTPADAGCDDLRNSMNRLSIARAVLIQTSVFGTDNSCLLDGLAQLGSSRVRAVVVPPTGLSGAVQDEWHAIGVRGVRLNLATSTTPPVATIREHIAKVLPVCLRNGWHLQLFLPATVYQHISADILKLPVPCVLDHFGMLSPAKDLSKDESTAHNTVMQLVGSGKVWVKLSGSYRIAENRHDAGIGWLARKLYAEYPQRMLWASDWPHTPVHNQNMVALEQEQPYRDIDSIDLLNEFGEWFSDAAHRQQILVENPAKLYEFE